VNVTVSRRFRWAFRRWVAAAAAWLLAMCALPLTIEASEPGSGTAVRPPKVVEADLIGRYGGQIRLGVLSDPKTFNPLLARETSSTQVLGWLFEGLVELDTDTGEWVPGLAHRWEHFEDGIEWTFYLREGVLWHDGVELTADDVVFTFDLIYDTSIPTSSRDVLTINGQPLRYEKLDRYTVKFTLPEPFAPLLQQLSTNIVPRHILYEPWREGRFNEMWTVDTPPREIIGTGPVRMVEYLPGERIVFERNPHYWRVDQEGNPLIYVDGVLLRITENQETLALMFEHGQTDEYGVRGEEYERFVAGQAAGNYTVHSSGPAFGDAWIAFNQNPSVPEPQRSWFTNLYFRRAVAHAIDKESMIDAIYLGRAVPIWGPVSPANAAFHNPDVTQYPYDLDRAAELLEEGGFERGPDGVLRDWNGNPVKFTIITNAGNREREAMGNFIREDLEALGMQVTLNPIDFNLLVGQLTSGQGWEAIILGFTGTLDPNGGRNVWHSRGGLHLWNLDADGPQPEWQQRIDAIFDQGAVTLDPEERRALYHEWQALAAEYVPLIYLVLPTRDYAVRNTLKNAVPTSYGGPLHKFEVVWLDQ